MSVALAIQPALYSFSADKLTARFNCQDLYQQSGQKAINELKFTSGITEGKTISLKYGQGQVIMTAKLSVDNSGTEFLTGITDAARLLPYFQQNFLLSRDFHITQATEDTIRFTAKQNGTGYNMVTLSAPYSLSNPVQGRQEILKPNYTVLLRLYCENADNSGYEQIYSGNHSVVYSSAGKVEIPIGDKLHEYISKDLRTLFPDIPEDKVLLCKKSCRRYYFEYAESYGTPVQVFKIQRSADYTVMHGGLSYVAQFQSTLENLLAPAERAKDRFLKQGNDQVYTRSNQPQYLYFFNTRTTVPNARLVIKYTYTDQTNYTKSLTIASLEAQRKYGFNLRLDQTAEPAEHKGKTVESYQVHLETEAAERISETRTYHVNYQYRELVRYFLSWSSFGTMDSRVCYGKGNSEFELFQKEASRILKMGYDIKQGSSFAYDLKLKGSFKVATGWLNRRELLANRDFYLSPFKYRYTAGLMLPIKIDSQKIPEIEDGNNLFSQLFEYSYQFDDHAYTETAEDDPGINSGDFFFSYGPIAGASGSGSGSEIDPTVPAWVKAITLFDIEKWNNIPGMDAKFVTITGDQIFTYSNELSPLPDKDELVITADEHNFTAADIERKWEYYSEGGWQWIIGSFGKVLTVRENSPIFQGTNSATIRYRVNDMTDSMTLVKLYQGSSTLTVVINSEFGDTFMNGNINTTLYANVYYGGDNITAKIPDSGFTWTRASADDYEDQIWNRRQIQQSFLQIDHEDVIKKAVFSCDIEVTI